ncbi:hypothetical protein [Nonomuraea sp. NPDC050202]|uniref:hypothetical protein n=1 Tax=Nonomuraea sp. NPDC050202 TaxID=3155035 RepID=UPI0033F69AF9
MSSMVTRHWPTNVVVSEIDLLGIVHDHIGNLLLEPSDVPFEILDPELVLASPGKLCDALTASMAALADADSRPHVAQARMEVQRWGGGYDLAASASPADYVAWCVLAATERHHEQSGGIAAEDPRAGCAMVEMPGLPWGRPLMIAATPGAHLAIPGWLTHFVVPVEKEQGVIVAVAMSV